MQDMWVCRERLRLQSCVPLAWDGCATCGWRGTLYRGPHTTVLAIDRKNLLRARWSVSQSKAVPKYGLTSCYLTGYCKVVCRCLLTAVKRGVIQMSACLIVLRGTTACRLLPYAYFAPPPPPPPPQTRPPHPRRPAAPPPCPRTGQGHRAPRRLSPASHVWTYIQHGWGTGRGAV
jgi:hypothetical protein